MRRLAPRALDLCEQLAEQMNAILNRVDGMLGDPFGPGGVLLYDPLDRILTERTRYRCWSVISQRRSRSHRLLRDLGAGAARPERTPPPRRMLRRRCCHEETGCHGESLK